MSRKEIETQLLIELEKLECDVEIEKEYFTHISATLRSQEIETILGIATITSAAVSRFVVDGKQRFHLTSELEFPREDQTYTVSSPKGDSATWLQLVTKEARKWALVRAAAIIQAEDRRSNILEIRRAQKTRSEDHTDLPYYYEDCACNHCTTRQRLSNEELATLCDGKGDC